MSAREKRKAEWLSSALAKKAQEQLKQTIKKILILEPEERGTDQQALLSQHETLVAQVRQSLSASQQRKKMKTEHEKEVEDPPSVLEVKLRTLADLIKRSSSRVVLHTGAGLSTPAGIPDFRGPQGVWTLQQKGQVAAMRMRYEDARPTKAHMLIGKMVRRGMISHVVSQNVDGLLLRAGVPAKRLSELHGCVYTEVCPACGRRYTRGYDVTAANGTAFRRHVTGRLCEAEVGDATSAEEELPGEQLDEREVSDATSAEESLLDGPLGEPSLGDATSAGESNQTRTMPARKRVRKRELEVTKGGERGKGGEDGCARATSSERQTAKGVLDERESARGEVEAEGIIDGMRTGRGNLGKCEGRGLDGSGEIAHATDVRGNGTDWLDGSSHRGTEEKRIRENGNRDCESDGIDSEGYELEMREAESSLQVKEENSEGTEQTRKHTDEERRTRNDGPGGVRPEEAGEQQSGVRASGRPRERSSAAARRLCGGTLRDTIVHFGERLDDAVLQTAREASAAADLAVALGTSLKVPPASTLPGLASTSVIVNLQWTAKDKRAALKINGRCEVVMERLAELLDLNAPEYKATEDPVLKLGAQKRGQTHQDCKVELSKDIELHTLQGRSRTKHKSRTRAAFPRPLL